MKPTFQTLDRHNLDLLVEALIAISADVSPWQRVNFEINLPEKWTWSFVALAPDPAGYAILSRKQAGWLHIHQFMVGPALRGKGLGGEMIGEAWRRATICQSGLTLKVSRQDDAAINFYRRHGFSPKQIEGTYLWMQRDPE